MALKFVAVLLFVGIAAAEEYAYSNPGGPALPLPDANGDGVGVGIGVGVGVNSSQPNLDSAPNAYNAAPHNDNSQATPFGYDYRPQQYAESVYNAPAKYDYGYSVHDDGTGDIKMHSESRDGHLVRGAYSVVDPDGYKRTVTYSVDNVSGFNAVVNREPYAPKPTVLAAAPGLVADKSQLVELPLGNNQPNQQTQQQQSHSEASHIDLPVQTHDSYAPTVTYHEGPYP